MNTAGNTCLYLKERLVISKINLKTHNKQTNNNIKIIYFPSNERFSAGEISIGYYSTERLDKDRKGFHGREKSSV